MTEAVQGKDADSSVRSAPKSRWEAARDRLDEAHRHRREGRTAAALRDYKTVMETPTARTSDRQTARAWSARMRLIDGERSALVDLQWLASQRLEPQLYAHVATSAMQGVPSAPSVDVDIAKRAIVAAATRQLTRASRVRGESGERARRWLDRVLARSATFFSP
ncbi:hypothetical protein [Planctomycetes bacterium Poly30]|uniref:hypothetical protein n=1 Tax=Saltatorellus ferox TaxID=2528018 RepID=UPI0011A44309